MHQRLLSILGLKNYILKIHFELDIEKAKTLLNNIYNYAPSNNLQKPVIAYLVHNYGDKSFLVKAANNLFRKIDINNNGTLDRNEFIKHCGDYYKKNNRIKSDIENLYALLLIRKSS